MDGFLATYAALSNKPTVSTTRNSSSAQTPNDKKATQQNSTDNKPAKQSNRPDPSGKRTLGFY